MTVEPMDCAAPERELVPFLAAGSLTDDERGRVQAHVDGCAACARSSSPAGPCSRAWARHT
jgi:hypothetical protein